MPTIQNRRATAAQWTAANPVLAAGEIGFEIDTNSIKVGDGLTAWINLPSLSDKSLSELVETGRLSEAALKATYALRSEMMVSVEPNMVGAVFSRNLYNPSDPNVARGYVLNGGLEPAPSDLYITSGWIPVKPDTPYTTYAARRIQFYDADKGYLSPPVDGASSSELTAISPSTAAFMRVSWFLSEEATIQVEEGDTRTDWVPYGYTLPGFKMPPITPDDLPPSPLDILEVSTAKNLYNPADATEGVFLAKDSTVPFATYTTSGFIPVEPGQTYTISSVRSYNWYNDQKVSVNNDTNLGTAKQATITAPSYAKFLRFATLTDATSQLQVERGSEATEWEPFGVRIKGLLLPEMPRSTRPVRASLAEDGALAVESYLGDRLLVIKGDLNGSANGAFNFLSTTIDGQVFHQPTDDVTPIRAMQTTVGANHGWTATATATNPDGKTDADAGSRWTDGVNEYAMLGVQDGKILLGIKPTPRLDGTTYSALWVAPTADLTHVAGATKTAPIPSAGVATVQLYPSVRDVSVTADMDGAPLVAGAPLDGDTLTVREYYWIIDYADLYDRITASPGTPHAAITPNRLATLRIAYQFTGEGRCLVTTSMTANRKMELGACGFVQSGAMARAGYSLWRRLPGVEPMNGYDLAAGADITNWTVSQVVNTSNLTDPTVPPQFTVDTLRDGGGGILVGFALGYVPDQGDGSTTRRLTAAPNRLWDLRSTRKNYPNAINSEVIESGESLSVSAFRAYLSPEEVGGFSVTDGRGSVAVMADSTGFADVPGLAGRPVLAVYGPSDTSDSTIGGGVSWSGGWGTARIDK